MRRAILLICALLLVVGCSRLLPQANQPPEAYISSISPAEATEGETVSFSGYGTDSDGEIVAYRWRSSIDGQLSTQASFQSDSLSVGYHIVYFEVQDDDGEWSDEANATLRIRAADTAPVVEPIINAFTATATTVPPREIVTLSWNVTDAETVRIDQGLGTVPPSGSIEVSPVETSTYELSATGGGKTVTRAITIVVDPPAQTVTLTPNIEMSGFIRSSGSVTPAEIFVGDDDQNRGIRGFLTYDISRIPKDAVITQVTLDLSGYDIAHGEPFDHLGCLSAFEHRYNTLHGEYLMPGIPGQIAEWCDNDDLEAGDPLPGFQERLEDRLHTGTFQFRLQFAEMETNADSARDMLQWPRQQLPRLTVEYYVPD